MIIVKIYDCDFDSLELNSFQIDKKTIWEEADLIYGLYKLGLQERRYELYQETLKHISKIEYGSGGYGTHRGYYCPDIYNTVAVGGYNRGKVLKRPTKRSKISFEFCYEKEHLILVKEFENPSLDFAQQEFIKAEFIERRGNIEIGVRLPYNRGASDEFCNEIETIHICQYDAGKLLNVRTFFAKDAHRIDKFTKMDGFEYEKTWIEYERGQVKTVHYLNYYKPDFWSKEFKSVDKITFLYNAEGLPVKYYHNNEKEWIYDVSKLNQQYYQKQNMKR